MKYISAAIVCLGLLVGFNATNIASANEAKVDTVAQFQHYDVYYHTDGWQHRYFSDHNQLHEFLNAMSRIGCSVQENGNFVYYHCPNERFWHFTNHAQAHNFENALRNLGFHTHIHH